MKIKLIMQKTWITKLEWDQPLSPELMAEFRQVVQDLPSLKEIAIPRLIVPQDGKIVAIATFCDGSSVAFGTTVYLIGEDSEGNRTSHLAFAKSKVMKIYSYVFF